MNYNAYKKRFEGQKLTEQQIKRRYNDELLLEAMRYRAMQNMLGGAVGGGESTFEEDVEEDVEVEPILVNLRLVWEGSYSGWVHVYLFDHEKNFIEKQLISSIHLTDNFEPVNSLQSPTVWIFVKVQDDPEPTEEDLDTQISLLGIASADIVIDNDNFTDLDDATASLDNVVLL